MPNIPIAGPWITEREVALVAEAARTAWYGNANHYNAAFEKAFAEHVGRRYAISLPSCTSGLHLALAALGLGPGDEVIVPESTWIASVAPVHYVGATPVFVDVDPQTWCMSAPAFERAITPRTKATIPVDLYGGIPDYDAIGPIAARHGIAVIEDAAEAIGTTLRGRKAGGFGLASAFSFHGSKTLTTGEGGMLLTDDKTFYNRCQTLRDHGREPGDVMFMNQEVAYKYKMSSMQAALGLAQLERIGELIERKRAIFGWYCDALADVACVTLNAEPDGVVNSYWMVTIVLDPALGLDKVEMMKRLADRGVSTRPFFSALSSIPAFRDHPQAASGHQQNPVAYRLGRYGINLPSALNLTREDVATVADAVKAILAGEQRRTA